MALLTESPETIQRAIELLEERRQRKRNAHRYQWRSQGRPKQFEPGTEGSASERTDWFVWLCLGGRGGGKSRTGAEFVRERIDAGTWRRVHVAGPTIEAVRRDIIEGPSGLLHVWPPGQAPTWEPSKKLLTCHNGAVILCMAAEKANRFRGPQADGGWCDEISTWEPVGMTAHEAWGLFELGIRLGPDPRIIATSTPKPNQLVKELHANPHTVTTVMSTYENREHLAAQFFERIVSKYENTRLGQQEIYGEILEDVEGAFVTQGLIDQHRVEAAPDLERIVVGVDPSGGRAAQGIAIAGVAKQNGQAHLYVLADRTCELSPDGWGRKVVDAWIEYDGDRIVVERNYGGDMCEAVIRKINADVPIKMVNASRGKHQRFEPLGALYEQGRVHHVGRFEALEAEICGFTPNGYELDASPNRADALVWAATELMSFGVTSTDLYGPGGLYDREGASIGAP